MDTAYLILADGTVFTGKAIGKTGSTIGETVFTTGMTGYLETLTDPSYFGQIVTQTFPLIGNYGVIPEDFESKQSFVRGYIVREISDSPSNFRCAGKLDEFLKAQNIVGICSIDTRALTKKLRESGVMNGMIISGVSEAPAVDSALLEKIKSYKIEKAVESVQNARVAGVTSADGAKVDDRTTQNGANYHVVLFDFGAKANIERELEKRGCRVTVVPCDTSAKDVLALNPDGIMLSNGPGDPAENTLIIQQIRELCEWNKNTLAQCKNDKAGITSDNTSCKAVPIFGICLGHQMLALARGAKTSKLKYGHRGGNHPCKDLQTDRIYITSQNHGYAVETSTLPEFAKLSFINVNDDTCEGVSYTDIPAFSVQFHPEACGGPHDTNFLFDRFIDMIASEVKKCH
ncbi:carbamoyl phosphate synthase small subunit [Treponema sp.]|uniref:carbamoyl phosphate synthase small subunit n=1 Tax=Treponema sp. TaxID=166 RepID=UPI00298E9EE9|nr:carbamoyl phosphate synthase small subunit [Treponema sp.]MCR5613879.1 carbamoyl phosphate synthase small subunit [Treponema sp.]